MAMITSQENVTNRPCGFHQTNNLDELFTDEIPVSMNAY